MSTWGVKRKTGMTKLLYVVVILVTVFVGLTFAYLNSQPVELKYLAFQRKVSLSSLLLCTLVLGMAAGFLLSWLSSLKVRRNLSATRKKLRSLQSSSR